MSGGDFPGRAPGSDPYSVAGKFERPQQRFDVIVVGAGSAGVAAAVSAAEQGKSVLLADENPLSAALIGLDAPLFFGGRATGAVQNPGRMIERVADAIPRLDEAIEAGVEVALGVTVWGAFQNGPGVQALPEPVVGLADDEKSWLCGFKELVVAAGARDLALAFTGWNQPGVMGANALHFLLTRYQAFSGRDLVVLGSGRLGLSTALEAARHGVSVRAIVEFEERVQGPMDLAAEAEALGIPILTGRRILEAVGGVEGVKGLKIAPRDGKDGEPATLTCDTICQAFGLVPAIELLDVLGAQIEFDASRGGHVPRLEGSLTSLPGVFATGDCAGVECGPEGADYALRWMRALARDAKPTTLVCQCEEVDEAALSGLRAPAYLGPPAAGSEKRDLSALRSDGPLNQDQIKRLTRACMGVCQARRCREQVAMRLAEASGEPLGSIPLAGYRAPVRPLPLRVLADLEENSALTAGWDVWFGIPTQWIPYDDIGTEKEAAHMAALGGNMHL